MGWKDTIKDESAPSWKDTIKTETAPTTSEGEAALKGLQQESLAGFSDEAAGLVDAGLAGGNRLLNKIGLGTTDPYAGQSVKEVYTQGRDEERKALEKAASDQPTAYGVGSIGGTLLSAALPGGAVVQGAASGLGHSNADNLTDMAIDTGLGGAGGYLAGKALDKAGQVKGYLAKKFSDAATNRAKAALGFTKGLRKGKDPAKLNKAANDALENGVISPLASTDDMMARTKAIKDSSVETLNDVANKVNKSDIAIDGADMARRMDQGLGGTFNKPNIEPALANKFKGILNEIETNAGNPEAIKALKDSLRKHGWQQNGRPYETVDGDMYRTLWHKLDDEYEGAVTLAAEKMGNPQIMDDLAKAKADYSFAKTVEPALKDQADKQGNKLFGLTDTIAAAGALGYGGSTGDWGTSAGLMALKKGGEKWGNQLSATAFKGTSELLKKNVPAKFRQLLENAAARGGDRAVNATHYLLMQKDPEYRESYKKSKE